MPVYLFTFHAYASWMPDRQQGYVHHDRGLEPCDPSMADAYRRKQREDLASFDTSAQHFIIKTVLDAARHLDATVHAIVVEPSHIHILLSWSDDNAKDWQSMRRSMKNSITRALNTNIAKRTWFSKGASRKRIRDRAHFDYHLLEYLPKHRGAHWFRERDVQAARHRAITCDT